MGKHTKSDKEKAKKQKSKKKHNVLLISGISIAIIFISIGLWYQFIYDPIETEVLQDGSDGSSAYTKVEKITHLKDGRVEYYVHQVDGVGSYEPDSP